MRCSVCDYCDDGSQSIYNQGITEFSKRGRRRKRYVFYDTYMMEEICSDCYDWEGKKLEQDT